MTDPIVPKITAATSARVHSKMKIIDDEPDVRVAATPPTSVADLRRAIMNATATPLVATTSPATSGSASFDASNTPAETLDADVAVALDDMLARRLVFAEA